VLVEQACSGCCVLLSSHQLDQVEDLCESVTIIDHGRLIASGRVDDLATAGARRLVVRVEGDREAAWARDVAGMFRVGSLLMLAAVGAAIVIPTLGHGKAQPQSVGGRRDAFLSPAGVGRGLRHQCRHGGALRSRTH
jgi:hypothetical protein